MKVEIIQPDGTRTGHVYASRNLDGHARLREMYALISADCHTVEHVALRGSGHLWMDEDGKAHALEYNSEATQLLHDAGRDAARFCRRYRYRRNARAESAAEEMSTNERCFACGRVVGRKPHKADTRDDQRVYVGSECWKLILVAGDQGYQPPLGGPRLFTLPSLDLCGGCNVRTPREHRCFGAPSGCECAECREADRLFGGGAA